MTESLIYQGTRGQDFTNFISGLLSRGKLSPRYMDILTNTESMKEYNKAFTAKDANSKDNYENYENMGDVTANKFIVWYAYKRFPQLDCPDGVSVVARLRINYGAKQSFAKFGEKLGFWPFISATQSSRDNEKKKLLEDTFESFIGCTEHLLDTNTRIGVGYAIAYDILKSIFDEEPISLEYKDLYDSLTRLKELFDAFHYSKLGYYEIDTIKNESTRINKATVYLIRGQERPKPKQPSLSDNYRIISDMLKEPLKPEQEHGILLRIKELLETSQSVGTSGGPRLMKSYGRSELDRILIGTGEAPLKANAEQRAAEQAIETLKKMGFSKPIQEKYKLFCNA